MILNPIVTLLLNCFSWLRLWLFNESLFFCSSQLTCVGLCNKISPAEPAKHLIAICTGTLARGISRSGLLTPLRALIFIFRGKTFHVRIRIQNRALQCITVILSNVLSVISLVLRRWWLANHARCTRPSGDLAGACRRPQSSLFVARSLSVALFDFIVVRQSFCTDACLPHLVLSVAVRWGWN